MGYMQVQVVVVEEKSQRDLLSKGVVALLSGNAFTHFPRGVLYSSCWLAFDL